MACLAAKLSLNDMIEQDRLGSNFLLTVSWKNQIKYES